MRLYGFVASGPQIVVLPSEKGNELIIAILVRVSGKLVPAVITEDFLPLPGQGVYMEEVEPTPFFPFAYAVKSREG